VQKLPTECVGLAVAVGKRLPEKKHPVAVAVKVMQKQHFQHFAEHQAE